jgi:alkylated DNA repair dioxygenase AlkB
MASSTLKRRSGSQPALPGTQPLPEGFEYRPELVSPAQEEALVAEIRQLPLATFQFQGYEGKRRVVSYGWEYDFNERVLREVEPMPPWLLPIRDLAAEVAGLAPELFPHVLITEYANGAGIGWHRDKGVFGEVVGISLLSPCRFRLRRREGATWERVSLTLAPRSAYHLRGIARTEWEHSIPETDALRYSISFSTLRS